ncbi:MAG: hypothetical protein JW384_02087 [Nitrosomonadaceae bacterium]|nr:hypothetical protein [Nitrosomonadaceae bacterium]
MAKRLKIPQYIRKDIRSDQAAGISNGIVPSSASIAKSLPWSKLQQVSREANVGKKIQWKFEAGDMVMFTCQHSWKKIRGIVISIDKDYAMVSSTNGAQTVVCSALKLIERLDEE